MKFDVLILLIIAFNIVAALMQRRAKKRARERQAEGLVPPAKEGATSSPAKARERRQGFLEQLAREMGLELPEPVTAPVPEPVRPHRRRSRAVGVEAESVEIVPPETLQWAAPPEPKRPARSRTKVVVAGEMHESSPEQRLPARLRNRSAVQEAWVMKEILEPPVFLRPLKSRAR